MSVPRMSVVWVWKPLSRRAAEPRKPDLIFWCVLWIVMKLSSLYKFHSDKNIIFDNWHSFYWLMFPWLDFISTFLHFQCVIASVLVKLGQLRNICIFQVKIKSPSLLWRQFVKCHSFLDPRLPNDLMLKHWLNKKNNLSVFRFRNRGAEKVNKPCTFSVLRGIFVCLGNEQKIGECHAIAYGFLH